MPVTFRCSTCPNHITVGTIREGVKKVAVPAGWEWRPAWVARLGRGEGTAVEQDGLRGAAGERFLFCAACVLKQDTAARESREAQRRANWRGEWGQA